MATKRFGYLDDFTLKNSKVGIGTSTPTEALEVIGGSRSQDIAVTGIATLTSYEGFQNKNTSYTENVNITGGESGTLSGEIVVGSGLTMSVGTGATTGQGSIKSLKVGNTFTPPIGGTNERPSAPKPGAIFYNKDFRTIEYWDGNFWRQVDNTTRRGRGFSMGGYVAPNNTTKYIQYFEIASKGNAQDFGQLDQGTNQNSATGNEIRSLCCGGTSNGSDGYDYVQYFTSASLGNAADFGNLTAARRMSASTGSSTRGLTAGGYVPSTHDTIDYVEIMTLGNSIDFGNLTVARRLSEGALSSPTRSVFCGGSTSPGTSNKIDYVTTASKGNATDFGLALFTGNYQCGCSNTVRGMWAGGSSGTIEKRIGVITIASTGNAIEFGNLTLARHHATGASNSTRACWAGGDPNPGVKNVIDYITIASGGEAIDFGDMAVPVVYAGGTSDSHGGLGGF